jgi:hypothetical protein
MTQIWQQIRLGRHVGFEEGESNCVHLNRTNDQFGLSSLVNWISSLRRLQEACSGVSCLIAVHNRNRGRLHEDAKFVYRLCMLTI